MSVQLSCWQCGSKLQNVIFPMSIREECANCGADQHVCKMCKEFDSRGRCSEPRAEDVSDREKANFCDYFKPSGEVFAVSENQKEQQAKAKLAALFGEALDDETEEQSREKSEDLSPEEIAQRKLRDMLNDL